MCNKIRSHFQNTLVFLGVLIMSILGSQLVSQPSVEAANTQNFNPEYIISDTVFTNSNAMSVDQIQSFLQSKNSVCLINFKTLSLNDSNGDGLGDEPYGKGVNEQVSAATVIWQAAQMYKVNPQVILATLQKEQGLITRTDCPQWRYNTALGYGCPDSAPCDNSAYGFTRQIDYGVWHFKGFFNDSYPVPPTVPGSKFIQYNPDGSCGGKTINIQNRATAALYSYTPYQPNGATLAAAMGQTVPCGAYGNLNFWRYFTDWFGSTTNPALSFSVIKSPDSPALYLQTSTGKHYIPSGEIMDQWGLTGLPIQQVSSSLLNSLPTGPWVGKLLKDEWSNYFVVEGGKLHYVRDVAYLKLWGINTNDAVQSLGIAYTLPSDSWLGRFVVDRDQPNGPIWLLNNGKKKLIPNRDLLYQWRYTPDQLTTVSATFLNNIPTEAGDVSYYASNGTRSYLVDSGRKLSFDSNETMKAYTGTQAVQTYDPNTLSFLYDGVVSRFSTDSTTGQWFMFENNTRRYIANAGIAELWGKKPTDQMTSLSNSYIRSTSEGENLSYIVQTPNPTIYWLIDGNKRRIADANTATAWIGEGKTPPVYSNESLAHLTQGAEVTSKIQASGSNYVYAMDNGSKRYLSTNETVAGWGGAITKTNQKLVNAVPENSFITNVTQSNSGQGYLIVGDKKYPIDVNHRSDWGLSATTNKVSDSTLSRFTTASTLKSFIKIGSRNYIMSNGSKILISRFADAYKFDTLNPIALDVDAIPGNSEAGYLIRSTDPSDTRMWLINNGTKTLLNFEQQVSFGYLSKGIIPTSLSPATIALIPTSSTQLSYLIQKQNSGIKLMNFGNSLGFPNSDTLINFVPTAGVTLVANSIFDSIGLNGSTSRVIVDDMGRYYLIINGQRRWIANGAAYEPYKTIPRTYLFGTTLSLIPEGTPIY